MRKILIGDALPELADQLVDQSLRYSIGIGSKEKVAWRCERGHEWDAIVLNRAKKGYGCPYCSGRLAIPGETDLATVRPDIAAQLVDKSLGTKLLPTSHKKVDFECENGHIYRTFLSDRVKNNSGCPYCSGRKAYKGETDLATTHPELAAQLVDQSLATKLSKGSNRKVLWRCEHGHEWEATVNSRPDDASKGCPYCAGVKVTKGVNDLLSQNPEVASMLVDANPEDVAIKSNLMHVWECDKGHKWSAPVTRLVNQGSRCPYCAGQKVIAGENDLATLYPDIASQLVDESLGTKIRPYSHKKVLWKCNKGHEWKAIVSNRVQFGYGCPICSVSSRTSEAEKDILNVVKTLVGNNVLENNRSILSGNRELDIVVPDRRVAIEFNGLYWHSTEMGLSKDYHYKKYLECKSFGYRLIQIWEDSWKHNRDLVVSFLSRVLSCDNNDVCDISDFSDISHDVACRFFDDYHLYGAVNSDSYFGLFDSDKLVAVVGVSKYGLVDNGVYQIDRFATLSSDVFVLSYLLESIEQVWQKSGKLLTCWVGKSYNDLLDDSCYVAAGFKYSRDIDPVHYVVGDVTDNRRVLYSEQYDSCSSLRNIYDSGMIEWSKTV